MDICKYSLNQFLVFLRLAETNRRIACEEFPMRALPGCFDIILIDLLHHPIVESLNVIDTLLLLNHTKSFPNLLRMLPFHQSRLLVDGLFARFLIKTRFLQIFFYFFRPTQSGCFGSSDVVKLKILLLLRWQLILYFSYGWNLLNKTMARNLYFTTSGYNLPRFARP